MWYCGAGGADDDDGFARADHQVDAREDGGGAVRGGQPAGHQNV